MTLGMPRKELIEAVKRALPCLSTSCGRKALVSPKAPPTCTSSTASNSAGDMSRSGFLTVVPALLTRIEAAPKRSCTASAKPGAPSRSVTSKRCQPAASPRLLAAFSSFSALVPTSVTRAPAATKHSAIARPRPLPPPLMTACSPASPKIDSGSGICRLQRHDDLDETTRIGVPGGHGRTGLLERHDLGDDVRADVGMRLEMGDHLLEIAPLRTA